LLALLNHGDRPIDLPTSHNLPTATFEILELFSLKEKSTRSRPRDRKIILKSILMRWLITQSDRPISGAEKSGWIFQIIAVFLSHTCRILKSASRHGSHGRWIVGAGTTRCRFKNQHGDDPMNKLLISAAVAALTLSTGAVFAQDAAATPEYGTVDANADASVTWEELSAAWPGVTEDQFKTADADASGGLSAEEYATLAVAPAQ
jgi:hypothetical protein